MERLGYASEVDLFLGSGFVRVGFGSLDASGPASLMIMGQSVGE